MRFQTLNMAFLLLILLKKKLKLKVPAEKKVKSDTDPEKKPTKGSVPYQRLKRARFVYSEWTQLLKNHSVLVEALTKSKSDLKKEEVSRNRMSNDTNIFLLA